MSPFQNRAEGPDNDAIRQLRDELRNLGRKIEASIDASDRLTRMLVAIALLQLLIAVFQIVIPLMLDSTHQWVGVVVELVFLGFIFWALKPFDTTTKNKN